jgi:FKBP-type peptidyl-prolyl cis-trans isomerase SlyD
VTPVDAYGERNEGLRQELDRSQFDDVEDLGVGMQFRVATEDDQEFVLTIVEVREDVVIVDGNHPLAGVALNFAIKVQDIREATTEEIDHGHVHGPGGHHH